MSSTILPFALVLMLTSIFLTRLVCQVKLFFYRSSRIVDYLGGHGATFFGKLHARSIHSALELELAEVGVNALIT